MSFITSARNLYNGYVPVMTKAGEKLWVKSQKTASEKVTEKILPRTQTVVKKIYKNGKLVEKKVTKADGKSFYTMFNPKSQWKKHGTWDTINVTNADGSMGSVYMKTGNGKEFEIFG